VQKTLDKNKNGKINIDEDSLLLCSIIGSNNAIIALLKCSIKHDTPYRFNDGIIAILKKGLEKNETVDIKQLITKLHAHLKDNSKDLLELQIKFNTICLNQHIRSIIFFIATIILATTLSVVYSNQLILVAIPVGLILSARTMMNGINYANKAKEIDETRRSVLYRPYKTDFFKQEMQNAFNELRSKQLTQPVK
jgi:hypothetical protein